MSADMIRNPMFMGLPSGAALVGPGPLQSTPHRAESQSQGETLRTRGGTASH